MPRIVLTTTIPAKAADCFELSLSVDAHTSSMTRSGERIIAGVTSGSMRSGQQVTWKARHFGKSWTMTSHIAEYDAPHHFVDTQLSGPFKTWWHQHLFSEHDGITTMTDIVEFTAPFGPAGRLAEILFLRRYLLRLLESRNEWLRGTLTMQK